MEKDSEQLNFFGVVRDDNHGPVEDAVVMLFACYSGGIERSIGSTLTNEIGAYHISVPGPPDYNGLLGFKVRAGKAQSLLETATKAASLPEATAEAEVFPVLKHHAPGGANFINAAVRALLRLVGR